MKFHVSLSLLLVTFFFASGAMAGDFLLSCDSSMEMRSSAECEAAMQMALNHVDCQATGLTCAQADSLGDYDCEVESDRCLAPDIDNDGDPVCPDGYHAKRGAGTFIVSELMNSRHIAARWAAHKIAICRRDSR